MFCCIQKVMRKKPAGAGDYKEYEVSSMKITFQDGRSKTIYSYYPTCESGRFERPHREAYKITVHESRRENGKVVKKQCVIATIGYYSFADGFALYDYIDSGIQRAAAVFNVDYETLYNLVESKIKPLADGIVKEFHKTKEYKARRQREKLEKSHRKAKKRFGEMYGVDPDEYDACYDIFGVLREEDYLNEIIRQYERRQAYRSYQQYSRDYGGSSGGYSAAAASNHTEAEKIILRQFYKTLAKAYHPDLNPGKSTTEAMALLNRLKENWGL